MRRMMGLAAVAAAVLAGVAVAQEAKGYLAAGAFDPMVVVGPPPAAGSAAEAADKAAYQDALKGVDTPRWREALADDPLSPADTLKRYACALDAQVDPARAPATVRLLQRTLVDADAFSSPVKKAINRPRPFAADTSPVCLPIPADRRARTSSTYPSGHATAGTLYGLVLSEVRPERTTQILARSRSFVESRQVCRVHYPSDLQAGERLGAAIFARLQGEPEYEADVKAARAEIAAAPRPEGCPAS